MCKLEAIVYLLTRKSIKGAYLARVLLLQVDVDKRSGAAIEDALMYATHKGYV